MKSVNVAKLKSQLSHFLKLVRKGESIVVMDRNEPVAEIIPFERKQESRLEQLIREGKIIPGKPLPKDFKISPIQGRIDIQKILDEVREDK